ncbi:UDP-glucose 4-epimerase [Geomicrobium sp. JCM 19037]|uniref:NAD-dependent epimerase/dehydratase family protein n=1 Tax=unclassified Geomicrobium TaxID=2628951 RepID=UPI00045F22A5|nr:NAD-dependent epimerase/dehydratase family protein [Geomicrobium sp. JCM 19037]GAK03721.1 UDP-glucose 4-epimerase [Geomicrobium sp. JCM 19037]
MKVLITGGAGFIGSHIVEQLVENHHEVVIVDYAILTEPKNKQVRVYRKNVCSNLHMIFKEEQPDVVIHHAAQVSVSKSMQQPLVDGKQNILATINVLKMCVTYGVKKVIFASSAAVYGSGNSVLVQETDPTNPQSFYGLSKLQAEAYIRFFAEQYGLNYTIFRYANVYGPGQSIHGEAGVVAQFIHKLKTGEALHIYGDGSQTRDFVFVKDVARANVEALTNGNNVTMNIGSGRELSILSLMETIRHFGCSSMIPVFKEARQGDILRSSLNSDRAYERLGWQPMYAIEEGLKETIMHSEAMHRSINFV